MLPENTLTVNPNVLEWARRESGWPVERVAKRLQVKVERVNAWEKGKRQPTLRQVEELSRFLHRPLSIFFLPKPPELPPLATEYRRLPGIRPGHESPELRLAVRQMLTRRENALGLMAEMGEPIPEFELVAHLKESPAEVGARLRAALAVPIEDQLQWRNEWEAWRTWRARVEAIGVLVFQFGKVTLSEVRGISLLHSPLPVVGINGKEIPEGKCYTLLHEVVHLMLAAGKEEKPALLEKRSGEEWQHVERFAEIAASNALLPEQSLKSAISRRRVETDWSLDEMRTLARRFRVTPLAMATRLRESGVMTWARYRSWREAWDKHVASLPPRRGGFATPPEKAINRSGRPFVQLVLEALDANRITSVDAGRYLDLKFEHFGKLRDMLSQGPIGGSLDE
jgi:Zn-dependent peptidase ImmA (M78 family)/DNA-binding XRE family transcriptional regulator